jgi:4-amino-4-deoxy-L-arabinose transferase-like glycosyltransferase
MTGTAIRWSGLPLIAGGVMLGAAIVLISLGPVANQTFSPVVSYLFLLSAVLLLVSLPGMYARQASAAGWLGLAGYALLQVGIVLFIMLATTPLVYPSVTGPIPENAPMFFLAIALAFGLLLTGLAALRAAVLPRWAGILLVAATASFFFGFFVSEYLPRQGQQLGTAFLGILLALPLAGVGWSLWTRRLHDGRL